MRLIAISLASLFLLSACGPEQSVRDSEQGQIQSVVSSQKSQLDQFQGDYTGYITFLDATKPTQVTLRLRSFSLLQANPGRLEVTEIPNIMGFIELSHASGGTNLSFNQGTYNADTGVLQLYGGANGNLQWNFMELHREGMHLVGEYWSSALTSQVSFTKTNN